MDFFNQRKRIWWFSIMFYSLLLYKNCKSLREFEEIEIPRQVTVNNKDENS